MKSIFYVKRVITVVEDERYLPPLKQLLDKAAEKGIQNEIYTTKELEEEDFENTDTILYNRKVRSGKSAACGAFLWITDSAEWAAALEGEEQAVLLYLHESNRDRQYAKVKYVMELPEEVEPVYLEQVYRRYAGLPWDILETARCYIRETTESDVDEFFAIYQEPSIVEYTEGLYPEVEQEKQYIREYIEKIYSFYGFGVWTIVEKATNQIIGRAGFSYREGYEEPELGFVIGVPWQHQGIAYEICHAILQYGAEELGFWQVQALVEPANAASLRLCQRLGFQRKDCVWEKGKNYVRLLKSFP